MLEWKPSATGNGEVGLLHGELVCLVVRFHTALKTYGRLVLLDDGAQEGFDSPELAKQFAAELFA